MTEAEAKTKWCPWARASDSNDNGKVSVNRAMGGGPDPECLCLASGCMQWRLMSPLDPDDGYCGRAAQPVRFTARSAEC